MRTVNFNAAEERSTISGIGCRVKVLNDARLLSADLRTVSEWDMTKILNCAPEILRVDFLDFFLLVKNFQLVDCGPKSRSSLHVRARTNVSILEM
jgi:hypothetical protein